MQRWRRHRHQRRELYSRRFCQFQGDCGFSIYKKIRADLDILEYHWLAECEDFATRIEPIYIG
jgi:hypothetical protein